MRPVASGREQVSIRTHLRDLSLQQPLLVIKAGPTGLTATIMSARISSRSARVVASFRFEGVTVGISGRLRVTVRTARRRPSWWRYVVVGNDVLVVGMDVLVGGIDVLVVVDATHTCKAVTHLLWMASSSTSGCLRTDVSQQDPLEDWSDWGVPWVRRYSGPDSGPQGEARVGVIVKLEHGQSD